MGRRPRTLASTTNKPLLVFATLLIVAGVVGVAYVSSMRTTPSTPAALMDAVTSTRSAQVATSTPLVVLVNESAITIMASDGTSKRLGAEEFSTRYKTFRGGLEGSTASTGAVTILGSNKLDVASSTDRAASVSPQGTFIATLSDAQADGAGTVFFSRRDAMPQKIVVRDGRIALKDPAILGWFSDRELMIAVTATSSRAVYEISSAGAPRFVAALPDNLSYLAGREGAVWYVTATPGEGLESPPKGPSAIHRIDHSGADVLLTRDELRVVTSLVPDPTTRNGRIAYTTDDGQAFVFSEHDGHRVALGKVRPLVFVQNGDLIVRSGYDLARVTVETGATIKLGPVPEGNVDVFDATRMLDARP